MICIVTSAPVVQKLNDQSFTQKILHQWCRIKSVEVWRKEILQHCCRISRQLNKTGRKYQNYK